MRWWAALAAIAGGLAVAGAMAGKVVPGIAAGGISAGIAAIGAVMVDRARGQIDQTKTHQRDRELALRKVNPKGCPYKVREIVNFIELGVHPASENADNGDAKNRIPQYVARDIDEQLRNAILVGGFVLIRGESTAGKSRAALEALKSCCPDHVLLVPSQPQALADLTMIIAQNKNVVVWLDDLERFFGANGLNSTLLNKWLTGRSAGQVVVVATIRTSEYQRFTAREEKKFEDSAREIWREAREVLDQATTITMERRWSQSELKRATNFSDDRRIQQALDVADKFGIAESLASGPQLAADWNSAWAIGAHPRAAAFVAAAVDARRAGFNAPISRQLLLDLHEHYLAKRGGLLLRPESEADAFEWASTPAYASSSLLLPANNGYLAFDYLLDLPSLEPIPENTWDVLIGQSTSEQLVNIGLVAMGFQQYQYAIPAFARAVDSEVPDSRFRFALALGSAGRPDQALVELRRFLEEVQAGDDVLDLESLLIIRSYIAFYASQSGDVALATQTYQELLNEQIKVFGPDHSEVLNTRSRLAECIGHLDSSAVAVKPSQGNNKHDYTGLIADAAAAKSMFEDLFQDQLRVLGPDHPETLQTRLNLATCIGKGEDQALALELFQQILKDQQRIFKHNDPNLFITRAHIAHYTRLIGNYSDSLKMYQELADEQTALFGPQHPEVLISRSNIADCISDSGDFVKALAEADELLKDMHEVFGPDNRLTLNLRSNMAFYVSSTGDFNTALKLHWELLKERSRIFGDQDPDTRVSLVAIVHCLNQGGCPSERGQIDPKLQGLINFLSVGQGIRRWLASSHHSRKIEFGQMPSVPWNSFHLLPENNERNAKGLIPDSPHPFDTIRALMRPIIDRHLGQE